MIRDAFGLRAIQQQAWRLFGGIVCMMVLAVLSAADRPQPDSYTGMAAMAAHFALTLLLGFSAQRAYDLWAAVRSSAEHVAKAAGG